MRSPRAVLAVLGAEVGSAEVAEPATEPIQSSHGGAAPAEYGPSTRPSPLTQLDLA